ncbi:MAG: hypothetical protein DRQ97_13645 [Gammaproteobacteria bacterium]|nr:MAG: hypothetical protein DRQ97_13645 [Gammaproteobacteria bacterium]
MYTTLEWVALGIWIFVIIVFVYGIIAIHDIPASVARKRNHPHVDAIEAAGWVSLFMMHALWPFLWIWAFYYRPELEEEKQSQIQKLEEEMDGIRAALSAMQLARTEGRLNDISTGSTTATQDNGKEA